MSDEIELVTKMIAWSEGRAMPCATRRSIAVREDAWALSTIALAGHDHTVQAIALGPLHEAPAVRVLVEPRPWVALREMLRWIAERLVPWFADCAQREVHPQLWVPSEGVAAHLDLLADLHRFSTDDTLRALGRCLAHLTERRPVEGQQSLVVATTALTQHWTTGQSPDDDRHLGKVLAWIDRPHGLTLADALATAECLPAGNKSDPAVDREVIHPALETIAEARRKGLTGPFPEEDQVHDAVEPLVRATWAATVRAARVLSREVPPMPSLDEMELRENEVFAFWCSGNEKEMPMPLRDGAKAAAFRLVTREDSLEQLAAARVHEDAVARARALSEGRVLEATVRDPAVVKEGRTTRITFALETAQLLLRVRPGDVLCWFDDPRMEVAVLAVTRAGTSTTIRVRMIAGTRVLPAPQEGELRTWGPKPPSWRWLHLQRKQMKARLAVMPWTHVDGTPPATPSARPRAMDLLAAVEGLR
jgi:hypothetical protein